MNQDPNTSIELFSDKENDQEKNDIQGKGNDHKENNTQEEEEEEEAMQVTTEGEDVIPAGQGTSSQGIYWPLSCPHSAKIL